MKIELGLDGLKLEDLVSIARDGAKVCLSFESEGSIIKAQRLIGKWIQDKRIIYGITTGFGALSDIMISAEDTKILQKKILMSHAAGVGNPMNEESVRAILALRIKDFARGYSGVGLDVVKRLVDILNLGILPVIPEKGSVGASGDLAPMAHLSLVLLGMGDALYQGKKMPSIQALKECGLKPVELNAGEGLALVNGTQATNAIGGLALYDALTLSKMADVAASMSLEVLMGSRMEFDPRIHQLRPHPGQGASADNMRRITQNSEIISSHRDCTRVQDAYTLRCSPQVHGASKDAITYVRKILEIEMNSSTNNPLILSDSEEFLLGGNFHGQPIGMALDFLSIAVSELASISERRIERLVNPALSGLPAFLVQGGGLNSGFMIAQYTAASLVSENKVLSHPACVDSIPTSANKEDHVPMSAFSARKCREIVRNTESVIAIELLCAAQAIDLFTNLKAGDGTSIAYRVIRESVPSLEKDRILSPDIETVMDLIKGRVILNRVENAIGDLY